MTSRKEHVIEVSEEQVISAGVGELVWSARQGDVLVAYGLGSCVGVAAYDPGRRIGGLLHAMLPERRNGDHNVTKFVDSGVLELQNLLLSMGANRDRLIWRYAGGAQMLIAPGLTDRFNVGQRNVAMMELAAAKYSLRVVGRDVGGTQGRTVKLYIATGELVVRYVGGEQRIIPVM